MFKRADTDTQLSELDAMTGPFSPEGSKGTTPPVAATESAEPVVANSAQRFQQHRSMFRQSGFFEKRTPESKPKSVQNSERTEALQSLFGALFKILDSQQAGDNELSAYNQAWDNLHKLCVNSDEIPGKKPDIRDADLLRLAILIKQKTLATQQPNWDIDTFATRVFATYNDATLPDNERSTFIEATGRTFMSYFEKGLGKKYFTEDARVKSLCHALGCEFTEDAKLIMSPSATPGLTADSPALG